MLKPQREQLSNGVAVLAPDVQSVVVTILLSRSVRSEGPEPHLAFGLVFVRNRVADRLDYPNPAERVGIVAAGCGFPRPSEAPRHRSQMPIVGANDRFSRTRAHSAEHQRRSRKGWCARWIGARPSVR